MLISVLRLAMLLLMGMTMALGCDCSPPNVRGARKWADIIFRGRVTGFQGPNVVFAVDRVWKGKVSRTFEMPAVKEQAACIGFWPSFLEIGKYLLVYARKLGDPPDYFTEICSRTDLVENSKDFAQLGGGYQPTK